GAPQVQSGGRDTDGDTVETRRTLPLTCSTDSDQAEQGITRRRNKPEDRDNPRPSVTSPEQRDHDANRRRSQADHVRPPLTPLNQQQSCQAAFGMLRSAMVLVRPVARRLLLRRFAAGTSIFGTFLLPP